MWEVFLMLMYCKKCGDLSIAYSWEKDNTCCVCGSPVYPIPEKYLLIWKGKPDVDTIDKNKKDQFIEECIKSSPEFDQKLFDEHDAIVDKIMKRSREIEAVSDAIAQGANPKTAFKTAGNIPHCPICGSTKLSKISGAKKAIKIGLFGIFGAGDLGKTWKCENCGSKF